jgi:hypothetical protein
MPAAIGIGLLVSAGTSIAAAKMQSNAAKNAQKAQQAGTDKALAVQQQSNRPYMQLGEQAANRLMQMPPQNYTQQFGGPGGSNGFQAFQQAPQGPPQGTLAGLGRPPQGGPMPQNGPGMQVQPGPRMPPNGPPPQQMGQQGGQMAQMMAPDGSVRPVPLAMVAQLESRGARRVG